MMAASSLNTPMATPSSDRTPLSSRTPPSTTSRLRADSCASLRAPPPNTRNPSIAGDNLSAALAPLAIASVDFDEVNKQIINEIPRAGLLVGEPTFVPSNTPAGTVKGSPRSHYGPTTHGLSQIPEDFELPEPSHRSSYVSASSVTSDPLDLSLARDGEITIGMPITPIGEHKPDSPPSHASGEGVLEHKDWGEEVEQDLDHSLARLSQLAEDLHKKDPSKPASEYYNERLSKIVNRPDRRFLFAANNNRPGLVRAASMNVEPGSPPLKGGLRNTMVTAHQFSKLEKAVEEIRMENSRLRDELGLVKRNLARVQGTSERVI